MPSKAVTNLDRKLPARQPGGPFPSQMAYFLVHSLAVDSYRERSVLYTCAISGTSGSSGFGSVSIEQMERRTIDIRQHAYL